MSHWTKVKSEIKDKTFLTKALTQLGWQFEEGNFKITQYGTTEKAEILLDTENKALGLSLQEDGTWALVGDPYHTPYNHPLHKYYRQEKKFLADLGTAYAVSEAKDKLEEQGFECVDNDKGVVGRDGKVRMTFQKLIG
jgi:hypothetical protein